MNSIPRMSRLLVAAIVMAGSPGSVYAASAIAPMLANNGGARSLPGQGNKIDPAAQARAKAAFLNVPLYFEANRGQTDASVKFFARAAGYNLYLTAAQAVMVLPRAKADKTQAPVVLRMTLKGANAKPAIQGQDMLPGRTSYFIGSDSSKWQVGVKQYAKVKFGQVYPGIDVVYYGKQGHVEHDFVVAPGANPGRILVGFEGAKGLRLDPQGNLIIGVDGGAVTYQAPTLYQMRGAERIHVKGRFALAGKNQVRFEVGDYIRSKELVIDPAIMYGTYLGGSVDDAITAIAVDASRQAYVTGWANSASNSGGFAAPTTTYPSTIGANRGGADVFVAKLSEDGSTLMWLAWLGGSLHDQANGIALEKNPSVPGEPKVYITGTTTSDGGGGRTPFPYLAPGTAMEVCTVNPSPGSLAFVAELSQPSSNPTLVYSTCWGDAVIALTNVGNSIAVDSLGAAYVTGTTFGNATDFPIVGTAAFPYSTRGLASEAAYVMKVSPGATTGVAYSMFLGSQDVITRSNAIAVDSTFHAWVAGMTTSSGWAVQTGAFAGHFAASNVGTSDGFVVEVNTAGTGLDYATYINGNSDQEATAIALNNSGATPYNVFVAGWTKSPTAFPSTAYLLESTSVRPVPYQQILQGADDAFILRLNPSLVGSDRSLEMVYATHVGAAGGAERANALALDTRDDAYIAGWTRSGNWPVAGNDTLVDCASPCVSRNVAGAVQTNTSTDEAAFVAAIGPGGLTRDFFSYLGGSPGTFGKQIANGIAIDALHNIYVAGITPSNTFPATTGSLMDGSAGTELINGTGSQTATDGFVVKIAPVLSFGTPIVGGGGAPPACTITSVTPSSGFAAGGTALTITGARFSGLAGPAAVKFGTGNAASYTVNSPTMISAVTPALAAGSVNLVVTTVDGSCSTPYRFLVGACGDDFFFPSPATGATGTFQYCMDLAGTARVRVYNSIGDLVAKVEDARPAGQGLSTLNTARLAPGVYLYLLEKDYGGGHTVHSKVQKFVVKH